MPTRIISSIALFLFFAAVPVTAAGAPLVAGLPADEAFRLGEAMYQKGVLPSGKPMKAIVQGDVEVTGTMVTCSNCHMRSGLGSAEGNVLTLPTNGARLYAPIRGMRDIPGPGMARFFFKFTRPEYTDEALAKALRHGIDPAGRVMLDTMPRYILDDREMEFMIHYLKNLSSELSPGVSANVIRFATIVTDEVSAGDRAALLDPLTAYIQDEWNANVPVMMQAQRDSSYRTASLDVWELKGAPGTWEEQLEAYYRKQPVFALLGGLTTKDWGPIHRFCEKKRVPSLFPITDLPAISEHDWYTLYFSEGYYQEGRTAAEYLARVFDLPRERRIIQVFREGDAGNAFAKGFADSWKKLGKAPLKNRVLSKGEAAGDAIAKDLAAAPENAALLLWLGPEDLAGIGALRTLPKAPSMIFLSSTMLGGALAAVPDEVREIAFLTWPNRLPGEHQQASFLIEQWLKAKRITSTNQALSAKVYFLTRMVSNSLATMRGDAYRDYFLDLFDIQEDQSFNVASYPRLSFGPGQRYASKGCYIVTLTKGPEPKITRQSDWVVY